MNLGNSWQDQLICGLHAEGHRGGCKNLTLQEAIETALSLSMEAAEKDSKTLQGSKDSNIQQVSNILTQMNGRQSRPSY